MNRLVAIRFLLALGIVVMLLAIPLVTYADLNDPDTVEIEAARVYRHMLEADDVLMVARYNVHYGNTSEQPTSPIDLTFEFTYTDSTGNVTGNTTAYPFHNMGYSKGVVSFYWAGNDTDKPGWEDLGNITITGTALFDTPPSDTLTLTSADWSSYASPADLREDFRQFLIAQALFLQLNWNNWYADQGLTSRQVDLLAEVPPEYTILSPSGEAYFTQVIDDLRSICPTLFLMQIIAPTHTEGNYTLEQQNIYDDVHGNDTIGDAKEGLSDLMGGIGGTNAATFVTLIIGIGVIVVFQYLFQKANIGMLIAYTLILLATPEGLFQMGIMALLAVIAVLYITDTLFWRRSQG